MSAAQTAMAMSPKLVKVAERARRDRNTQFTSVSHLIDYDLLRNSFDRARAQAAVGVDKVSKGDYARNLEENLRGLHERLRAQRYRHQPIRRVHIYKEPGKTRPIGISTFEDKLVQTALQQILSAIYEPKFYSFSYGFRPGRSAHDAIRDVRKSLDDGEVNTILEADITGFFDNIDRKMLMKMLREHIVDGPFLRLVGKCLRIGVLEDERYEEADRGTAQGSTLSPVLGNIFLHNVLDVWIEQQVRPRMRGRIRLWRYADDFLIGFELKSDADRVMEVLGKRMSKHGLALHPDKTRVLNFRKPPRLPLGGKGPGSFNFLGFSFFWKRTRRGAWRVAIRTRTARLHRAMKAMGAYCRQNRHASMAEQREGLARRLRGHYNYFAVQGNFEQVARLFESARRIWHKWLNRRSQRGGMSWERFAEITRTAFPLPRPRICVQIW